MFARSFAAIALAAALSTSALAQSGAGGEFTVHNITEGNIVNNFYTSEDAENWSESWMDAETVLRPGESMTATFFADTGPCQQYFVVAWMGANGTEVQDDVTSIDICAATNVYLGDNEIFFD